MLLVRLISEHSTLHATSTPATRPCYPRYRPVLSQVDSTEAEALRRRTAKQPNDLNAMPDCLPSTLQHNIHPRLLRDDSPVARAHGKSPSPRRAWDVLSTSPPPPSPTALPLGLVVTR